MSNGNYTIVNNMERFTAWQIPNKKEAANLYDLHIPDWMAATIKYVGCDNRDYWIIEAHTQFGFRRYMSGDYFCKTVNDGVIGVPQEIFNTFFYLIAE